MTTESAATLVVHTICEVEVVVDISCTFEIVRVDEGGLLVVSLTKPEHPPSPRAASIKTESTALGWNALQILETGPAVRFPAFTTWLRLIDPLQEEKYGRIAQTNTVTFSLSMN